MVENPMMSDPLRKENQTSRMLLKCARLKQCRNYKNIAESSENTKIESKKRNSKEFLFARDPRVDVKI